VNGENYITRSFGDLYFSPNTVQDIKSRKQMGGACNAFWGEKKCIQGFWWGNLRERNHFEDLGVEGKIILKWTLKK